MHRLVLGGQYIPDILYTPNGESECAFAKPLEMKDTSQY